MYSILLTIRAARRLIVLEEPGRDHRPALVIRNPRHQLTLQALNRREIAFGTKKNSTKTGLLKGQTPAHPVRLNRPPQTPRVLADSNTVEIEASHFPCRPGPGRSQRVRFRCEHCQRSQQSRPIHDWRGSRRHQTDQNHLASKQDQSQQRSVWNRFHGGGQ